MLLAVAEQVLGQRESVDVVVDPDRSRDLFGQHVGHRHIPPSEARQKRAKAARHVIAARQGQPDADQLANWAAEQSALRRIGLHGRRRSPGGCREWVRRPV